MPEYADVDNDSGVESYEKRPGGIRVVFKKPYYYFEAQHVAAMKKLADAGNKLNTYINKNKPKFGKEPKMLPKNPITPQVKKKRGPRDMPKGQKKPRWKPDSKTRKSPANPAGNVRGWAKNKNKPAVKKPAVSATRPKRPATPQPLRDQPVAKPDFSDDFYKQYTPSVMTPRKETGNSILQQAHRRKSR